MKQKQIRFWSALAVSVVTGIVATGLFLEDPSATDVTPPPAAAEEALVGEGLQPAEPAPGDEVSASALAAPPGPAASTPDSLTNAAPSPGTLFAPFHGWLSRYQQETDPASKARLEAEGEALARQPD